MNGEGFGLPGHATVSIASLCGRKHLTLLNRNRSNVHVSWANGLTGKSHASGRCLSPAVQVFCVGLETRDLTGYLKCIKILSVSITGRCAMAKRAEFTQVAVTHGVRDIIRSIAYRDRLPMFEVIERAVRADLEHGQSDGLALDRTLSVKKLPTDGESPHERVGRLARILASERGQSIFKMAVETHHDGEAMAKLFSAMLENDALGMDLSIYQQFLSKQVEQVKEGFSIRSMFGRAKVGEG